MKLGKNFKSLVLGSLVTGLVSVAACGPKTAPPPRIEEPQDGARIIEHTVLAGETLDRIADNYYGDPQRASDIARENGITAADHLTSGSVVALRFAPWEWEEARRRAAALDAYNRGVDLLGQERLAEAGRQFEVALETAPDLVAARYNLALVQMRRGRNEEALVLLLKLTEDRPADTDFRFALGNALYQLTRFDEAVYQFSRVLEQDPDQVRSAYGLARALEAAGHRQKAISAWRHYLELDSTSSWAEAARRNLRKLQDGDG